MALEDLTQLVPEETILELINQLGAIGKWLQALGIIIIVWLLLQITNFVINRKRINKLNSIENQLKTLDKKIDKLAKKSSR